MCYDEGRLLAYLDDEVNEAERAEIAAHIRECDLCAATVRVLDADRATAAKALATLQAGEVVPIASAAQAPARTSARTRTASVAARFGWSKIAAVAAALLFAGSFAFGPVRMAAANFLQIFRVQKVQTIAVTQEDLTRVADALQKGGHVNLESFGEAWIDGAQPKPKRVTVAQAQAAVDFPVKLTEPSGHPKVFLQKAQSYRFKLNVANINQALAAYGSERMLPDSLNGKVFAVNVPPIVLAQYPVPAGTNIKGWPKRTRGVYVGQARSPQIVVPEGVDPAQLRDVLLNLPFLPESVRTQLASIDDWQNTLIIPNVDGSAHDVTIDGVSAVVISPKSAARATREKLAGPLPESTTVIWNDNGVVRAVGGPINEETAIALAKSMVK